MGLAAPPCQNSHATETTTTQKETYGLTREDASTGGWMIQVGESLQEASMPKNLLTMKTATRIGTWNVCTM